MFAIGYLRLAAAAFFAASRWTLYAIATACFCGLPAPISRLRFSVKAFSDADFFSGIVLFRSKCFSDCCSFSFYSRSIHAFKLLSVVVKPEVVFASLHNPVAGEVVSRDVSTR